MKTSAELRFGFWDVTARGDAALTATENQPFDHAEEINRKEALAPPDVATLEPNFGWPLDGSKSLMPADKASVEWGWWSASLSGDGGAFARPPVLAVAFTQPHSSMGITLAFLGSLPGMINVKWYGLDGALLADQDFRPDALNYFCDCQVENYGRVEIKVWSMREAHRYLRVVHIIFGALEILDGGTLQAANLCEEVDPSALTLPVGTLEAGFCAPDGRFSLLDPLGAYRLFQRRQPIEAYEYLDEERRYLGIYYLKEASGTVDSVTQLRCESILGVLDGIDFPGGIYAAAPVRQLLDVLLTREGVPYELAPEFEAEKLTGWLPFGSKRAALQQVAFALGAVIDPSRRSGIAVYPAPAQITQWIVPERKATGHSVKLEALVTRVDVTAHSYRLDDEAKELSKSELETGKHTIRFSQPSEVSAVSGATLVESGQNYAVLQVETAGEVVITGKEYVDNPSVCSVGAPQIWAGERESVKEVTDATLVGPERVRAAAQRLYDYYQNRYTDEGTILPGTERVGAGTELSSLGGRALRGIVQRLSIDLTGGYLSKLSFRGR